MNYEFVDFYPDTKEKKKKNKFIGTVHLYCIREEADLRGIRVMMLKDNKFIFHMPNIRTIDPETNKPVTYPIFSYVNKEKVKEIIDFMNKKVKPAILEKLGLSTAKK